MLFRSAVVPSFQYAARPAVAESRLRELPDGRIAYSLKKRWKDGTTAVVMTKEVLMERLCALVPKPRKHLVTYHGVLAPASSLRPKVVPRQVAEEGVAGGCRHGGTGGGAGAESAEGVATDGVEDVAVVPLKELGERVPMVNLEIIEPGPESNAITMRVHERGAGITQACGTGACASAWAAVQWGLEIGRAHV